MFAVRGIGMMYQGAMLPSAGEIMPAVVDGFLDAAVADRASEIYGSNLFRNFGHPLFADWRPRWSELPAVEERLPDAPIVDVPPPFIPPVPSDVDRDGDRPDPEVPDPLKDMDLPLVWVPWIKRKPYQA